MRWESSIRGRGAAGDSEFTGRDAQYCPLWPCDGVSGLGQNARTTGGAGILPAAILRKVRLGRPKWTVLGETPTLLDLPLARHLEKPAITVRYDKNQGRALRPGLPHQTKP